MSAEFIKTKIIRKIVIVGAGQAAASAAQALRRAEFGGAILLIGKEAYPPYERPPLSKAVLLGKEGADTTFMFSDDEDFNLEMKLGVSVTKIDRVLKIIETDEGETISYDRLILTMGGEARRLPIPGSELEGVSYLRSMDDALALRKTFKRIKKLIVIGGGWIGLEAAATARKMSLEVDVVEAGGYLCARAAPAELSRYLHDLHARHGVNLHLNASVKSIERCASGLHVSLGGGDNLVGDHVLVGIGLVANTQLASKAGLNVGQGVITSPEGKTSDTNIYACGDVTEFRHRIYGQMLRLESWENANLQAESCARALLGQNTSYETYPWFWSDQHGVNIQMIGLKMNGIPGIIRGDLGEDRASIFYLNDDGTLSQCICINAKQDMAVARRLMDRKIKLTLDELQNSPKLKALLKRK